MKGKISRRTSNRVISLLAVLALLMGLLVEIPAKRVRAANEVNYVAADGSVSTVDAVALDGTETTLEAGWYVVNSDITFSSAITFSGNVNLILGNDTTMTVAGGCYIDTNGYNFTIYRERMGTGLVGSLVVLGARGAAYSSGIVVNPGSTLTINGGNITSTGDYNYRAAIGGTDNDSKGGTLIVNAGSVTLNSSNAGCILMDTFTINGGTVKATGETDNIKHSIIDCSTINYNGGQLVVDGSALSDSSKQAFSVKPELNIFTVVSADGRTKTMSDILPDNISADTFKNSFSVSLTPCTSHVPDSEGIKCKNCGAKYVQYIEVTDLNDHYPGISFDTTATYSEGVEEVSPVVWTDYSDNVVTVPGCLNYYYVTVKVKIKDGYIPAETVGGTINDGSSYISESDGVYTITRGSEGCCAYYHVDLSIPSYPTSLEYGDVVDQLTAEISVDNYDIAIEDLPSFADAPITYESTDTDVATVDASTGEVTIVGLGTFRIEASMPYGTYNTSANFWSEDITVSRKNLTSTATVEYEEGTSRPYNGTAWTPDYAVYAGDTLLEEGTDYDVAMPEDMTSVGTKFIGFNFKGNYSGAITSEVYITRNYGVVVQTADDDESLVWDSSSGGKIQSGLTGEMETVVINADEDYYFPANYLSDVRYTLTEGSITKDSTSAECGVTVERIDSSTLQISGSPEFLTTVMLPPAAEKYDWDVSLTSHKTEYTFGNADFSVAAVSEDNIEVAYESSDSTVADVDETGNVSIKHAGKFEIVAMIAGDDNHKAKILKTGEIVVNPRDVSNIVKVNYIGANETTYTGSAWTPRFNVSVGNTELTEGTDYEVLYPDDMVSAGSKVMTVSMKGDYTGTYSISGSILEAPAIFDMPKSPYQISGKKGENDFYITDVVLTPANGYLIKDDPSKEYAETLTLNKSFTNKTIYLYQKSNGCESGAISIPDLKIDPAAPRFIGLSDGASYYSDEYLLVITDDNLDQIKVNDKAVAFDAGSASIYLSSDSGFEEYTIWARDKAGNTTEMSVTVYAPWMESRVVPQSQTIRLKKNKTYSLDEGTWTVQGDDTEYSGGIDFYISREGEYIFEKVK